MASSRRRVLVTMMNTPFMVADGTTFRTRQILRMLAARYETYALVIHFSNQKPELEMEKGVTALPLPGKFIKRRHVLHAIAFLKSLRARPDLLYVVNDAGRFSYNRFVSNFYGIPLVYELHSIGSKEAVELGRSQEVVEEARRREKRVAMGADHIVALSEEAAEFYGQYSANVTLVPATVAAVKTLPDRHLDTRRDFRTLGVIGPFERARNLAELQFIHRNLQRFDARLRFKVIGICNERVEDPRIEYTGLIKGKEEFLGTIADLDAVIVPSSIATFGPLTKIVETMALGVPVFTTPKGATGIDHLENGENIVIAPEEDLVERVNGMAFDETAMRDIGRKARETVQQHFSLEANAAKLYRLIDGIVDRGPGA